MNPSSWWIVQKPTFTLKPKPKPKRPKGGLKSMGNGSSGTDMSEAHVMGRVAAYNGIYPRLTSYASLRGNIAPRTRRLGHGRLIKLPGPKEYRVSRLASMLSSLLLLVLTATANAAAVGPTVQRCPADFELVRRGQTISASEARYIEQKREKVLPAAFQTYLKAVQGTGVALPKYVEEILNCKEQVPTVGISTSGGGYRGVWTGHCWE